MLHVRGFSGAGLTFLALLAACFLLFNVECRSLTVALAMMPDLRLQRVFHQTTPASIPPTRRQAGTILWVMCSCGGCKKELFCTL